jgi:hypothetical protein
LSGLSTQDTISAKLPMFEVDGMNFIKRISADRA